MLLQAEKILSHDDVLLNKSDQEMLHIVRHDLAEKIVEKMISSDLMKVMVVKEMHDDFGDIIKIRASVRAYNPDD